MKKLPQDCWIALGVLVVLVAAAVVGVYLPQNHKREQIHARTASLRSSLEADSQRAAIVPDLLRQNEALKRRYKDFDRKLPKNKELGGFLAEITNNLAAESFSDPEITPRSPTAGELYHTLPILMRCRGSYLALASFLQRISRMQRLTRVHSLKIQKEPRKEDLNIEMQLNIYFTET